MANYVWRGISGQQGDVYYFNPAAWTVNGAATTKPPGPGDTVTIDQSSPGVPLFAAPGATTGDTVSGQTINFTIAGSTLYYKVAHFNGTDLDASTTLNFTGLSQVQFDGSGRWSGVVNAGTPAGSADVEVVFGGGTTSSGAVPELLNTGTVNVTNGSKLSLFAPNAIAGNLDLILFNPSSTKVQVRNEGVIDVSGGSTFFYSRSDLALATSGLNSNTLVNNGTIRVRGGAGQTNTLRLNTDMGGSGTIVMDGGDAASNLQTWLITTGDVRTQTVVLRNAWWTASDSLGYARIGNYDARGNFISGSVDVVLQGGGNTIYLEPSHVRAGDTPTPDIDTPFGATIYGFTAGDTLMAREPYSTDVYVSWDQSKQTLSVIDPSYDAGDGRVLPQVELARFYLEGQYAASDFVVGGTRGDSPSSYDDRVWVTTTNARNAGAAPAPTVTFTPDRRSIQDTPGNQRYVGDAGRETLVVAEGARGSTLVGRPGGEVAFVHAGQTDILRDVSALRFLDGRLVLDAGDPAAQVARLYQAALGRAPETGGLSFWAGRVQAGVPLAELARGFLDSAEFQARIGANATDTQFVTVLYRNVLGREPDAGGLQYWTGRLSQGAGRASVLVGLSESAENKQVTAGLVSNGLWVLDQGAAQVARLYDTVFDRVPDAGGLAFWSGQIAAGAIGVQGVADRLVGSAEFQARYGALGDRDFVSAMYANTLDRAPDAGGLDFWTSRLGAGATRAAVVAGLSESAEHQQLTAATVLGNTSGQWGIVTA